MAMYVNTGDVIPYTSPSGNLTAGDVVVLEDMIGVVVSDVAEGVAGALRVKGAFVFDTDDDPSVGEDMYWDAATSKATETANSNAYLGRVSEIADLASDEVTVLINFRNAIEGS